MRSGMAVVGAALAWLASCAPEPAVLAAEVSPVVDGTRGPERVAAAAGVVDAAGTVGAQRAGGGGRVMGRSPAPPVVPGSLSEFIARLDDPVAPALTFTPADLTRLFVQPKDCDRPGGRFVLADLDGDGRDEAIAAIGDGWWGSRVDLCLFGPAGGGFALAQHQRFEGGARGVPIVNVLPGVPRWVHVGWTNAWGTGLWCHGARWFELEHGRLVEVLSYMDQGEYAPYGIGMSFDFSSEPPHVMTTSDGARRATVTTRLHVCNVDFAGVPDRMTVDVAREWRQAAPGLPFVVVRPTGAELDCNRLCELAARGWLEAHHAAVRNSAATWTFEQQLALRRTCESALEAGPMPVATGLLALLPPETNR